MADQPSGVRGVEEPAMTLILNERFIASIGEGRLPDYVGVLDDLGRRAVGGGVKDVTATIRRTMEDQGFPIGPIEAERLAEQLIRADGGLIAITRTDGTVIQGPGEGDVQDADPGPQGTDDPANPDRPVMS